MFSNEWLITHQLAFYKEMASLKLETFFFSPLTLDVLSLNRCYLQAFKLLPQADPAPHTKTASAVIPQHPGRSLAFQPHFSTSAANLVYLSIFFIYFFCKRHLLYPPKRA